MAVQTQELSSLSIEEERRRSKRRPHVCEAWVRSPTESDEAKSAVTAIDLSRHGLSFESHRSLAQGCFYWIEVGFGGQKIASEIRIISCVESDTIPGIFRIAGEFC